MTYRVIQWATGQVGKGAVLGITEHPDLELVGAWVHSPDKHGRDVGEICGVGALGVAASNDVDEVLAINADCVVFAEGRAWTRDPEGMLERVCTILRSGKNVANATWPALVHPMGLDPDIHTRLHDACIAGGSTFYTTGIDPGFGSIGLALGALTVAGSVSRVRTFEILNYSNWDQPEMLRMLFGYGQTDPDAGMLFTPGYTARIFQSTIRLIAESAGIEIDEITETHDVILADETFDIACMTIPAGTVSGSRFEVRGMVDGVARVVIEHVTRLRDDDYADAGFPNGTGGYRAVVEGDPNVTLDLSFSSPNGDAGYAALLGTSMAVVNAIPQVCAAAPGVITYADLLPHPSRSIATTVARNRH